MHKKRYWLRFGVIFLTVDVILSVIFSTTIVNGLFLLFPALWIMCLSLAINPFIVSGTFAVASRDESSINFLLIPNGIYLWPLVWFIIGSLIGLVFGLVYGKFKK